MSKIQSLDRKTDICLRRVKCNLVYLHAEKLQEENDLRESEGE